jgi:predicted ATPase
MRYVLTGGPSCGKTTSINNLRKRGFSVLEETARQVLEERKDNHVDEREILARQRLIFERQLQQEESAFQHSAEGVLFLDRSLVDIPPYCNMLLGYVPKEIAGFDYTNRYEKIFVLERLPFEDDGLRIETEEQAQEVHDIIVQQYQSFGYSPILVPVLPVEQRTDYILDKIKGGAK